MLLENIGGCVSAENFFIAEFFIESFSARSGDGNEKKYGTQKKLKSFHLHRCTIPMRVVEVERSERGETMQRVFFHQQFTIASQRGENRREVGKVGGQF